MSKQLEVRSTSLHGGVEFRAAAEDSGSIGTLRGYAAVFNKLSQNLGGFVEEVDRGAFTKSLADKAPVMARYNHEDSGLLGTTQAETLRLGVDDTGLWYEVDLPDTQAGRDVRALAARGDVQHSSFAFYTISDDWGMTDQGFPKRTLTGVQLVDVAPVNNPAYRDTSVAVRALAEMTGVAASDIPSATEEVRAALTKILSPDDAEARSDEEQDATGQADSHPALHLRRLRDRLVEQA
jgi:HK97 family phage prohead protease